MAQARIQLSGWQAVVAVVIVIIGIIVRLATFGDQRDNAELVRELEFQLTSEYFPDDVQELKAIYKSGDKEELAEAVESITTTELTILSVQTSSPLLSFRTNEKVIVKVTYSLDDSYGNRQRATQYYRFRHGALGNTWRYQYRSSVLSYYLNFF